MQYITLVVEHFKSLAIDRSSHVISSILAVRAHALHPGRAHFQGSRLLETVLQCAFN